MKGINLFLATLLILSAMSFKGKNPAITKIRTGIYGVCGNGTDNTVKIELNINENFTFHYFDNCNPSKIIDVKGNWTINNNIISLKDYKSNVRIDNRWQIDTNEKCLKSRKGLKFTRLCHLKSCE